MVLPLENLRKQHKRKITALVIIVACGLIIFGAFGLADYFRATHGSSPTVSHTTVTHSTDTPDETPISTDKSCGPNTVSAPDPRIIEIPAIGVSACIQKVGIDQKGAIAVPSNIHLAGWYVNSVAPGSKGNSIIDGHLFGRYASAVFSDLSKLHEGDSVKIQMGDLTWHEFTIMTVKSFPENQAIKELFAPAQDNAAELSLITCGGKYDNQKQTYTDRVIVRARLNTP